MSGHLPALVDVLADAEALADQLIAKLGENYDPGTASDAEAWPGMLQRDLLLAGAVSDVRTVLRDLAQLFDVAASPVMFAAPPTTGRVTGEGRPPGLAQVCSAPGVSSNGADHTPAQAYSFPATTPGRAVTADCSGDGARPVDFAPSHGAGPISDPRPRHTPVVLDSSGVRPGVGQLARTAPIGARWSA